MHKNQHVLSYILENNGFRIHVILQSQLGFLYMYILYMITYYINTQRSRLLQKHQRDYILFFLFFLFVFMIFSGHNMNLLHINSGFIRINIIHI